MRKRRSDEATECDQGGSTKRRRATEQESDPPPDRLRSYLETPEAKRRIADSAAGFSESLFSPRSLAFFLTSCLCAFPAATAFAAEPLTVTTPAPAPPTFLSQLETLPTVPDEGGPRVWTWNHKPGVDPANPEDLAYARVAGGVLCEAGGGAEHIQRAAAVCRMTGAHFGLRLHPYHSLTFWRAKDGPDPDYNGPKLSRELLSLYRRLTNVKRLAGDLPVSMIAIDVETWVRDDPKAPDRAAWNDAILDKHLAVLAVCRWVFPDAPIVWYNYSPVWRNMTLREPTRFASLSMYYTTHPWMDRGYLRSTIAFQYARSLDGTAVFVSPGSGWEQEPGSPRRWEWLAAYAPRYSFDLGRELVKYNNWSVHDVFDYSAHSWRSTKTWQAHVIPFFHGLLNQPFPKTIAER